MSGAVTTASSMTFVPPAFRFVMEVSTWIWLYFYNWVVFIIDILLLALLNVPGDKERLGEGTKGIAVPGRIRFVVEVGTAFLGIGSIYILAYEETTMNKWWVAGQVLLVLLYLVFDAPRLWWLLRQDGPPPAYVIALHKNS